MKRALLLLLVAAGCSRDLTVPPYPPAGSVSGRIVYAVPGRSDLRPARGAVVALIGSGVAVTANQAGTFSLNPLEVTEGLLHFTFDTDGDGLIDRQKVEQLTEWQSGPNRQVAMGDVVLGENAAVRGKVALADRPGAKSGLSGTAVFVPEGPFAATTADDGSFVLPNLPEGPLQFYVYRAGYAAKAMGTVPLRAGEDYSFRDIVLSVSTDPPGVGSIVGSIMFQPSVSGAGDTAIVAQPLTGASISGVVSDDLTYRFDALPEGLYTLVVTREFYTRARVFNVLVLPLRESNAGVTLVTSTPELDGGQQPSFDAGPVTPSDGGLDGGPCTGPNCTPCLSNAQCGATQWCDNFYCAPQCSGVVACSNGRTCDSVTKTCVTPCGAGCPMGGLCVANVCRAACDGSFMCSVGFKCDAQNRCVPECATEPDCNQQHLTCVAGQCVPKGTCDSDLDCAQDKMCLVGLCVARPTARSDGGTSPFTCTTACNCKLGELCTGGLCLPDAVPTLFLATDGDGGGTTMSAPSPQLAAKLSIAGANDVLALRAGDRFYEAPGFTLSKSKVTVIGGFEVCGANRWVRSDVSRTTLAADGGSVVQVIGTAGMPVDDVGLRSLTLLPAEDYSCTDRLLKATDTRRLEVSRVDGALLAASACGSLSSNALVQCVDCQQAVLSDVTLKSSAARGNLMIGIELLRSDATVRRFASEKQSAVFNSVALVQIDDQTGPVTVQDSKLPDTSNNAIAGGIVARGCYGRTVTIERNSIGWGRSSGTSNHYAGVEAENCHMLEIRDNVIDGTATVGSLNPGSFGMKLENGGGTIERNIIKLPRTASGTELAGIYSVTAVSVTTMRDNTITGGDSQTSVDGIRLETNTVPTVLVGNTIDVGPSYLVRGVFVDSCPGGVRLLDNFSRATGNKVCGSSAHGVELQSTDGLVERNRLVAQGASGTRALVVGSSRFEVYSNHLFVGSAECAGESTALYASSLGAVVYASGNTLDIDADPATTGRTTGIVCNGPLMVVEGNVISSGRAATRRYLTTGANQCQTPSNYNRNYFWNDHMAPTVSPSDMVLVVLGADAGVFDVRGNVLADNTNPFDLLQPKLADGGVLPRHRLSSSSIALNRGPLPKRADLSDVWLDLDKAPRDAGTSADLGCCERY